MKALAMALFCLLIGCSSTSGPGVEGAPGGCKGANCARSSTAIRGGSSVSSSTSASSSTAISTSESGTGGSSSSTTESGGSSSSGGTTSSSGSSGSSNGGSGWGICYGAPLPDGGGCADGSFRSEAVDFFSCVPVAGALMQALDPDAVPLSGSELTAADGTFVFCDPPGTPVSLSLSATGYATMYFPEIQANISGSFAYNDMMSNDFVGVLETYGLNLSQGTILVHVDTSTTCPDPSGWTLSLSYADGGAIPDGGYKLVYLSPSYGVQQGATATTTEGSGLFVDIDVSTTNFFHLSATSATDAGVCTPLFETAWYTGRSYVTANAVSTYAFQVRP